MNKKELVELLLRYDHHYHTLGEPLVQDDEYDRIKDQLYDVDPKNKYFRRVGADIPNGVDLPYYMGSMNKIRDDQKVLDNWLSKYNTQDFIIMEKLDGISALFVVNENKLYTRGNGIKGSDISFVLPYINIPKIHDKKIKAIRGELIMKKSNFKSNMGTNARNTVAGLLNGKVLDKKLLPLIDFIVYQVLDPNLRMEEGLKAINNNQVVYRKSLLLTISFLKETLMDMRSKSDYEIDGIVICENSEKYEIEEGNNPKHAFAFKTLDQHEIRKVIVTDIDWNLSKDNVYKPRVLFNTVLIDGANISVATGYNAKYISDNGIGIGAEVEIIRSGAVIPKIIKIIKKVEPEMPPQNMWKWNETHVEALYIGNTGNQQQEVSEVVHFFKQLNIKNMAESTVKKLNDQNFKSLEQILSIKESSQLENIERFGSKTIDLIIQNINLAKNHKNVAEIMSASNMFGRSLGTKKLQLVVDNIPNVAIDTTKLDISQLTSINGIGPKNAEQIKNNIERFRNFYKNNFHINQTKETLGDVQIPILDERLKSKTVVFTGIRDKELEDAIIKNGGKVVTSVSSKVDVVILKDINSNSSTVKKAKDLEIKLIEISKLSNKKQKK